MVNLSSVGSDKASKVSVSWSQVAASFLEMSHVQATCSRRDAQITELLSVHAKLRTPTSSYMERSRWALMPARTALLWLVKVFILGLALYRDSLARHNGELF